MAPAPALAENVTPKVPSPFGLSQHQSAAELSLPSPVIKRKRGRPRKHVVALDAVPTAVPITSTNNVQLYETVMPRTAPLVDYASSDRSPSVERYSPGVLPTPSKYRTKAVVNISSGSSSDSETLVEDLRVHSQWLNSTKFPPVSSGSRTVPSSSQTQWTTSNCSNKASGSSTSTAIIVKEGGESTDNAILVDESDEDVDKVPESYESGTTMENYDRSKIRIKSSPRTDRVVDLNVVQGPPSRVLQTSPSWTVARPLSPPHPSSPSPSPPPPPSLLPPPPPPFPSPLPVSHSQATAQPAQLLHPQSTSQSRANPHPNSYSNAHLLPRALASSRLPPRPFNLDELRDRVKHREEIFDNWQIGLGHPILSQIYQDPSALGVMAELSTLFKLDAIEKKIAQVEKSWIGTRAVEGYWRHVLEIVLEEVRMDRYDHRDRREGVVDKESQRWRKEVMANIRPVGIVVEARPKLASPDKVATAGPDPNLSRPHLPIVVARLPPPIIVELNYEPLAPATYYQFIAQQMPNLSQDDIQMLSDILAPLLSRQKERQKDSEKEMTSKDPGQGDGDRGELVWQKEWRDARVAKMRVRAMFRRGRESVGSEKRKTLLVK